MYLDPFVFELFRRSKSFRPVMLIRHDSKAYAFLPFDDKDVSKRLKFVARLAVFLGTTGGALMALDYSLLEMWPEWNLDPQNITLMTGYGSLQ